MPEQTVRFELNLFGGLNEYDQANSLVRRAYQFDGYQYGQVAPVETPSCKNIDFSSVGLSKRKGSTEEDNISGILVANEELIAGYWFRVPDSSEKPEVIVGKKSIYVNRTGTWVQVNNANGTAYTHNADVTKATFTLIDQRLFICIDGNNPVQVYSSGANLDDPLYAYSTGTTVDVSSASGQKVLSIADTTNMIKGARVIIDKGNANEESGYIASVQAGVSITLEDNLTNTHAPAVTVAIENRYLVSNSSTYKEMTGNLLSGYYMSAAFQGRIVLSNGTTEYAAPPAPGGITSGIWDLTNTTTNQATSAVRALTTFTPYYTNSIDENLYIGTHSGWEIAAGLGASDYLVKVEGSRPPFNHQCFCNTRNWLMYLTADKNVFAINGTTVLDIGRRAKSTDRSGTLDSLDTTASEDTAFAHYYADRKQAYFHYSTDASYLNDTALVVDLNFGEPSMASAQGEFEREIRLIKWTIKTPATNKWFVQMYRNETSELGLAQNGYTYNLNSGDNDLGTVAIECEFYSPIFFASQEMVSKQFLDIFFRGINLGNYDVFYSIYLDRSEVASITNSFNLGEDSSLYDTAVYDTGTYSETQTVKGNSDVDVYREALQWSIMNDQVDETFLITSMGVRFMQGAEER
jgi:hypothetical protein